MIAKNNQQESVRVRIEEKKQIELFRNFLKKFKNDFDKASNYLGITRSSLSKYKGGVTKHFPKEILLKIIGYLDIDLPEILYSGTLREIRSDYMKKAYPTLKQKYGPMWAKELTNRRDFRGIGLKDFPDYTFVYLEKEYRNQLFEAAYDLFGSLNKLSKAIGISPTRLSYWLRGEQKDYKSNKVGMQFIPLVKLKIMSKYLVEDHREEFSIENVEHYILMYRMQAGNPIKNPKFLIKESPEMVRILFHLLGDGYSGAKGENANYKNICVELLEEFKNDLRIFGEVPIYEQEYSIKFPRILAQIIEDFYEVKCSTYESYISNKVFQIPKRNLYFGIRAFADDEATMYPYSIRFSSANYKLLKGIKQILDFLKIKSNDIKSQFNPKSKYGKVYYLDVRDLEKYRKHIGFTHPKKKALLENYVKRIKSRRRRKLLKP